MKKMIILMGLLVSTSVFANASTSSWQMGFTATGDDQKYSIVGTTYPQGNFSAALTNYHPSSMSGVQYGTVDVNYARPAEGQSSVAFIQINNQNGSLVCKYQLIFNHSTLNIRGYPSSDDKYSCLLNVNNQTKDQAELNLQNSSLTLTIVRAAQLKK